MSHLGVGMLFITISVFGILQYIWAAFLFSINAHQTCLNIQKLIAGIPSLLPLRSDWLFIHILHTFSFFPLSPLDIETRNKGPGHEKNYMLSNNNMPWKKLCLF